MGSKKPSARARQRANFAAELGARSLDDLFEHAESRERELADRRDAARYEKACASKNRYASKAEALEAIVLCAEHGRRGLSCYKCSYCGGWHLTSHPWKD